MCRWKVTNEIVAIKKMKKSEMILKNQVTHIRAERDVLALAENPWIVELKCSFTVLFLLIFQKINIISKMLMFELFLKFQFDFIFFVIYL